MGYKSLKLIALLLICALTLLLSKAATEELRQVTALPAMSTYDSYIEVEALARSIDSIDTIEYVEHIKTTGLQGRHDSVVMHYYYKKPNYLRVEMKSENNVSIDIYTPIGMYEYFPLTECAYYREKWSDGKPVSFQLEDKLHDIIITGKYEAFKTVEEGGREWRIIRAVDEVEGKIFEHRIWLSQVDGFMLPSKEEYLVDGEINRIHEYEYIWINKYMDDGLFKLHEGETLKIYSAPGIPKLVNDELEAEKYVNFNVHIPEYIPENYIIDELSIIPPIKTPSFLITYSSLDDSIYFKQKNTGINKLSIEEYSKVITVEGVEFAIDRYSVEGFAVRWVKNGIEYEVSGSYVIKDEIKKIVHSISKKWIWIE